MAEAFRIADRRAAALALTIGVHAMEYHRSTTDGCVTPGVTPTPSASSYYRSSAGSAVVGSCVLGLFGVTARAAGASLCQVHYYRATWSSGANA